jgi:hypothetical protein
MCLGVGLALRRALPAEPARYGTDDLGDVLGRRAEERDQGEDEQREDSHDRDGGTHGHGGARLVWLLVIHHAGFLLADNDPRAATRGSLLSCQIADSLALHKSDCGVSSGWACRIAELSDIPR